MHHHHVQLQDGNGQLAGLRNKIINGDFLFNQREEVTYSAVDEYTADRWVLQFLPGTSAGSFTPTPIADCEFSMGMVAGADGLRLAQAIELPQKYTANQSAPPSLAFEATQGEFRRGTEWTFSWYSTRDTAMTGTLEFHNTMTGVAQGAVIVSQDSIISTRPGEVEEVGGQLKRHYITLKIDQDLGNNEFLKASIDMDAGDLVTGVQLEKGAIATPYEFLPVATQRTLCERYYQITPFTLSGAQIEQNFSIFINRSLRTHMRVDPVISLIEGSWALSGAMNQPPTQAQLSASAADFSVFSNHFTAERKEGTIDGGLRFDAEIR